jgi:hypothetical protein
MKARDHNSPIIQKLIDETTPEELEKINKEMKIEKYLEIPHQETIVSFNTLQTKPFDDNKIENMSNNKQQTAVEWLMPKILELSLQLSLRRISQRNCELEMLKLFEQAKEMEKEQMINSYANGQADTLLMIKQKINKMKDIPMEFNQIISENFWNLV